MAMGQFLITSSMPTQTSLTQDKNAEKPQKNAVRTLRSVVVELWNFISDSG
jgi:hypothetical protein